MEVYIIQNDKYILTILATASLLLTASHRLTLGSVICYWVVASTVLASGPISTRDHIFVYEFFVF
jgi:hypothetical protein